MGSLSNLADRVQALRESVPVIVSEKAVEAATVIVTDLTNVTPADTGAAISNWQLTLDTPAEAPREPFNASPRGRMRQGVWTHAVDPALTREANAPPTLDAAKIVLADRVPGQPIFISNVLPYAEILDQGSSDQAPAGFVDRAVILAREIIDKIRFSL